MNQKFKLALSFLCGAALFGSISTYAATSDLLAKRSTYKVTVNGVEQKLSNSPITIEGSAYLPVREMGGIAGYEVGFKGGVISLTNGDNNVKSEEVTPNQPERVGINELAAKYSIDGELDGELLKKAIESGDISVDAQDKVTGESLLHLVIKEDN